MKPILKWLFNFFLLILSSLIAGYFSLVLIREICTFINSGFELNYKMVRGVGLSIVIIIMMIDNLFILQYELTGE